MKEKDIKQRLQQAFDLAIWKELLPLFFKKVVYFNQPEHVFSSEEKVISGQQIGTVKLDDGKQLAIFTVEVASNINIVRNRQGLRDIAAKYIDQNIIHGALAFFYNKEQVDYRFSFIAKEASLDLETGELITSETKPKRYTYLFGKSNTHTTPARQLLMLMERAQTKEINLDDVKEVFSVEALNNEFYKDYQAISKAIIRHIHPLQLENKLQAHQSALNLLNRMMFVYFIQKKSWIMNDQHFLHHFWQDYLNHREKPDTFHTLWLNKIFFKAFNGRAYDDPEIFTALPQKYHEAILSFPYLNGGLFHKDDELDDIHLADSLFVEIFEFLQKYNFTIIEDSDEEVSLEINPELLGKMYEGMINASDLDDVDAEHGIVYTERPEINFMVRRSLVEVLDKKLNKECTREFLYHFCFDKPDAKIELLKRYKANSNALRDAVMSITALDPSCGSGSMLIGVIQVQIELLHCLAAYDGDELDAKQEFYLKKQIISECIYGVDVKEWAVRIAELRFWLYMISDAEFNQDELTKAPLLPNLDFKLRQGNSLIQEIGNKEFSLKGLFVGKKKHEGASKKLNDFIKKKKAFITNQQESNQNFKQLKEEELSVFKAFITEILFENNQKIKTMSRSGQGSLFGEENKGHLFANEIAALSAESQSLEKLLYDIKTSGRLPFSFDIDFMEIFLTKAEPGFDLIIGNPPYVRQEDILPADDALELERLLHPDNKAEKAKINKTYKEKLSQKVLNTYPFLATKAKTAIDGKSKTIDVYGSKVPGRSDLYVYFQLLMPALLNRQGTFCFIISNSWLDVGFGGYVQQFLLKHTQLNAIYDCSARSFAAKVNTIIYLHSAILNDRLSEENYKTLKPNGETIRFIMNKADYSQTAYAPLLIEQEHVQHNTFRPHYRVILKTPPVLWEEAYNEESHQYQSNKWGGKYLRAPEIYYTILEKGKNDLVPLKHIADVKYGIKTGANDYFILSEFQRKRWGIDSRYLMPILKSSKNVKSHVLAINGIEDYLLVIPEDIKTLDNKIQEYIRYGEIDDYWEGNPPSKRSTCRQRTKWYSLPLRQIAPIACNYMVDTSMKFFNPNCLVVDNFQEAWLKKGINRDHALYALNSTLFNLFLNVMGRGNFGDGLMKLQTFEVAELITINPSIFSSKQPFEGFFKREIKDFFSELGFNKDHNIRNQVPQPLPDRKAIDEVIFDALNLTSEERNEVYWATAELIQQRLEKAGSRK